MLFSCVYSLSLLVITFNHIAKGCEHFFLFVLVWVNEINEYLSGAVSYRFQSLTRNQLVAPFRLLSLPHYLDDNAAERDLQKFYCSKNFLPSHCEPNKQTSL